MSTWGVRSACGAALAAVTGLLVLPGSAAPSTVPQACIHQVQALPGGWTLVAPPAQAADRIQDETVVGRDTRILLATDGSAVFRSTDGGCSWATVYTVPPADHPYANSGAYVVQRIVTAASAVPAVRTTVYLVLASAGSNVVPSLFVVSHDGGATWTTITPAPTSSHPWMPVCNTATLPSVAVTLPTAPATVYLACEPDPVKLAAQQTVGGNDYVYRSTDGAQSWAPIAVPNPPHAGALAADPSRPNVLWWSAADPKFNGAALFRSDDGGGAWRRIGLPLVHPDPQWSSVSLGVGGAGARTQLALSWGSFSYESTDDAKHWVALKTPTSGQHMAGYSENFIIGSTLFIVQTWINNPCVKPPSTGAIRVLRYRSPTKPPAVISPPRSASVDWGRVGGEWQYSLANTGTAVGGREMTMVNGTCSGDWSYLVYAPAVGTR